MAIRTVSLASSLGCACFAETLQNFSERQILWSLCLVVFLPLTLKLPNQTSLPVAPKLTVSLRSGEKSEKFMKTSTPQSPYSADVDAWYKQTLKRFEAQIVSDDIQSPSVLIAFYLQL